MLSLMNIARFLVPLFLVTATAQLCGQHATDESKAAFDQLKSLDGDWKATTSTGIQKAHFELIADNSVVASRLSGGMPHDMHTMFHMDGSTLMLTHYCAMHNQPRMMLVPSGDPKKLVFKFKDGTNIVPGAGHMNGVVFTINGPNLHTEEWIYVDDNGKETATRCEFRRKP
jgi:hypothetical protein